MARPKKNNADYFSHDADMRNDDRIRAVRKKFKSAGYAIYCMFLEYLTDKDYFKCEYNDLVFELMSGDFDEEPMLIKEVIDYCSFLGLFQITDGFIRCKTLENRLEGVLLKRKPQDDGISDSETTQSKVKESKVFKIIGDGETSVIVKSPYPKTKHIKIYSLEEYFRQTGQFWDLQLKGWLYFAVFMAENPGKIFNDEGHLYNSFKDFSSKYQPPARAPDKFEKAAYNKTLWTLEAWEKQYDKNLKNDSEFRKYFGYGELPVSVPMGGEHKN